MSWMRGNRQASPSITSSVRAELTVCEEFFRRSNQESLCSFQRRRPSPRLGLSRDGQTMNLIPLIHPLSRTRCLSLSVSRLFRTRYLPLSTVYLSSLSHSLSVVYLSLELSTVAIIQYTVCLRILVSNICLHIYRYSFSIATSSSALSFSFSLTLSFSFSLPLIIFSLRQGRKSLLQERAQSYAHDISGRRLFLIVF